jgi:glycerol-3-phosphate dehydrogenase
MTDACFDLVVIGGGINGVGIARDAAGRGLSVALCEQDDLGSHTSSNSTKLIHGGLRYLEHGELRLVGKALREREIVLAAAPHLAYPLRFVLPHEPHLRPVWMIRAGLFLYDHLAPRSRLRGARAIDLATHPAGIPLRRADRRGFVYSDVWIDDARLVVVNAMDAAERGARILPRTRCTRLSAADSLWRVELSPATGSPYAIAARAVVNAAGPWAARFLRERTPRRPPHDLRLVKGSHIVVPRLFDHDHAYIFQNDDRRIAFAIPYERDFTLIGTTDVDYAGDPAHPCIDAAETAYLCDLANRHFRRRIDAAEIVWSYSGVRPLLKDESGDPAAVTRDYDLELDPTGPPLLSVFGGKLTTYRKLAEEATDRLVRTLDRHAPAWTTGAPLPGGDMPNGDATAYRTELTRRYPDFPATLLDRWHRAYGTRVERWLAGARSTADLGTEVLPGLHEAELHYLREQEWARTAEDILWRRSKLGLHLPPDAATTLARWLHD